MLKKIVVEAFGKIITDDGEASRGGDYINKITKRLEGYIRPRNGSSGRGESFIYTWEIPSIPGGFLRIEEVNKEISAPRIERINARFEYLEAPEGDLNFVREAIIASGLGSIVGSF